MSLKVELDERLRQMLAEELEKQGESGLAVHVRNGSDNSHGGTAAIKAMVRAYEAGFADRDDRPRLGCATTGELLDEIRVRIEIHARGGLNYRTIDAD